MNVPAISNARMSGVNVNFGWLATKPKSVHEDEVVDGWTVTRNVEESYLYRLSNESKDAAKAAAQELTKISNVIVDGEQRLKFEQGTRTRYKGQLPFSEGEWVQYTTFNKNLSKRIVIMIEELLKRYSLEHYIRKV